MNYGCTCIKLKYEEPQKQCNVTTEEYIHYGDIFIKCKYLEKPNYILEMFVCIHRKNYKI